MPASHLKCHSHIKSVSLSCCGNLSHTLCPGWQRGPLLAGRPGLGAGTSYSAHSNKGAHVPPVWAGRPLAQWWCLSCWQPSVGRFPLWLASLNRSWFSFSFSLLSLCATCPTTPPPPPPGAPLVLLQSITPVVRPSWKRHENSILIQSPKGTY